MKLVILNISIAILALGTTVALSEPIRAARWLEPVFQRNPVSPLIYREEPTCFDFETVKIANVLRETNGERRAKGSTQVYNVMSSTVEIGGKCSFIPPVRQANPPVFGLPNCSTHRLPTLSLGQPDRSIPTKHSSIVSKPNPTKSTAYNQNTRRMQSHIYSQALLRCLAEWRLPRLGLPA